MNNAVSDTSHESSLDRFLSKLNADAEVFIYGCGMVGKWVASHRDPRFKGFIDTDIKKRGKVFEELRVRYLEDAALSFSPRTYLLITTADIADVILKIKHLQNAKWVAAGPLIADAAVQGNTIGESDEFVRYAVETVVKCHAAYLDADRVFLRSVDLMITERCSLKCKDCANLMQYYEKAQDIPLDKLKKDFDDLVASSDEIHEIRLIGGEPFMNKDIYKAIAHVTASPKVGRLVIYSNATIPLREDQLDVMRDPKVVFSLTDYGSLSKNTDGVAAFLERHGIPYRRHLPENWTDSGVIEDNGKGEPELKTLFNECCGKNLFTVSDGKLYRCPFAANADRLHAVPPDPRNGVSLKASHAEIRGYIYDIEFLPACQFCRGRSFSSPEIVPAIQTKRPIDYKKFAPIEIHTIS